jgi:hypothetical protein
MRFHRLLALVFPVLLIGGCEPLPEVAEPVEPPGLVSLDSLPAEYGELVAVTPHTSPWGPSNWYELWFSDAVSGRVTLVAVWRPGLRYAPSAVKVVERTPSASAPVNQRSTP